MTYSQVSQARSEREEGDERTQLGILEWKQLWLQLRGGGLANMFLYKDGSIPHRIKTVVENDVYIDGWDGPSMSKMAEGCFRYFGSGSLEDKGEPWMSRGAQGGAPGLT